MNWPSSGCPSGRGSQTGSIRFPKSSGYFRNALGSNEAREGIDPTMTTDVSKDDHSAA